MTQLTITEALQEIKTINARLLKKRTSIGPYIGRDVRLRDPFDSQGGSEKFIKQERQSITDLEHRIIRIRLAIQTANLSKTLTLDGSARIVADWLTWRREVAPGQKSFLSSLYQATQNVRKEVQQRGGKISSMVSANVEMTPNAPPEVMIMLDEQELLKEIEQMETVLGTLDGKLSLFNATTMIEV